MELYRIFHQEANL